jgi:homoaconitase/3-isopropylmalate dehydratase large subunit
MGDFKMGGWQRPHIYTIGDIGEMDYMNRIYRETIERLPMSGRFTMANMQ